MNLRNQYALSTLGKTIPFAAADAFSLYFYTDVAGIPPALAGAMVLTTLCWSALCDPLAGWLYQTKAAQNLGRRGYFIGGTLATTAFYILGFYRLLSGGWIWVVLLVMAMGFRFAYSLVDVPHNALLSALQRRGQSPAQLGAMRLGATIAGTLITVMAARYALGATVASAPSRFFLFAIATGFAGALLFLGFFPFAAISTSTIDAQTSSTAHVASRTQLYVASAAFVLSAVAATIINGMFSKDIVYIAKYVLHDTTWSVTGLVLFTIGKIVGLPGWILVSERNGTVRMMAAAIVMIAATGIGIAIAPPHFSYLGTGLFFFGVGIAGTNIAGWALIPSCAGFFRKSHEPLFFGVFTAANKIASGLSGAIIGYTLTRLGIGGGPISHDFQAKSLYWLVYIYPILGAAIGIASIFTYAYCARPKTKSSATNLFLGMKDDTGAS